MSIVQHWSFRQIRASQVQRQKIDVLKESQEFVVSVTSQHAEWTLNQKKISKGSFAGCKTQQTEAVFNKILGTKNKTYPGLFSMLQGLQKCIA